MQINNINNTQQKYDNANKNFKGGREFVRLLANPDSLATTVALETSVTGGRGINAYRRGGINEFRERFTDDVVSAVFWMKGVDIFNKAGNWIGKNVLKLPTTEFDVGKDALRTPFENLSASLDPNNAEELTKKLAAFKFSKIVISSLLATAFVGFALPKINQAITERIMSRNKMEDKMDNKLKEQEKSSDSNFWDEYSFEEFDKKISNKKQQQSFKGIPLTTAAHILENNRIAKMLTTDVGIITGRVSTARNADEAREYFFRDSISPFFYYASTPLIYKGLQILTGTSNSTSIDPVAAKELHQNMLEQLKQADGSYGTMTVEEFGKRTLGKLSDSAKELLGKLPFKEDVISLKELKNHISDEAFEKAKEMAKLQPEQAGVGAVLTKQQVADVLKNGSINEPAFMQKIFKGKFGEALTNPFKYISMKKITTFRDNIEQYGNAVINAAKRSNNGIVDKALLEKVCKKGFVMSSGFRAVAMGISALFLGFIIPKMQYAMTARRTGTNAAPGLRQYEEDNTTKV